MHTQADISSIKQDYSETWGPLPTDDHLVSCLVIDPYLTWGVTIHTQLFYSAGDGKDMRGWGGGGEGSHLHLRKQGKQTPGT